MDNVWVFNGAGSRFSGGAFTELELAEQWIGKHKLTGVLTLYPINSGVYDWAIKNDLFEAKNEKHLTPQFIQGFTSASQEHFHYENGERE